MRARETRDGGRQDQKHSPPPVASERTPNQGAGALASTTPPRALRVGRCGRPRSAREGGKGRGGTQGRIYKGRHSASSLLRSAESATGTVGEEGGSRKGERQTAVTSAVQDPGYLFIRYPLFFFLPPKTSSSPPSFCFLFGSRRISGKGEKAFFQPFSFFCLPPFSPLPHLSLLQPFPPHPGRSFLVAARTGSELLGGGGAGFL